MIFFENRRRQFFRRVDFRLVNVFSENVSYDRFYKLPFNIISCRGKAEKRTQSYIRNELDGSCWPASGNQILFIPYGVPIFVHRRPDFFCHDVHFTLESIPGIDLFQGLRTIYDLSSQIQTAELEEIFRITDPVTAVLQMQAFVFRICAALLPSVRETPKQQRFQMLTRRIRDEITADWTVEKMAREACMSTGAFSREFSREMHCTAKEFLQKELLIRALFLLQDPGKDIQAVSDKLHFSSPFYFSKFFRRMYGVPPREYVKRMGIRT